MSLALAKKQSQSSTSERQRNSAPSAIKKIQPAQNSFLVPIIRRDTSCPCGGGCPRCKDNLVIQPKLKIGSPNDQYEQEADQVAEQVMLMPVPSTNGENPVSRQTQVRYIQRICTDCEGDIQRQPIEEEEDELEEEETVQSKVLSGHNPAVSSDFKSSIQSLKGNGQSLPDSVRGYFEPSFGYDFSSVRIHTSNTAAVTAKSINARAFTLGKDIVFGSGQYLPNTKQGKKLIAHELTHVVQQGNGKIQTKPEIGHSQDEYEQEAKENAENLELIREPLVSNRGLGSRQNLGLHVQRSDFECHEELNRLAEEKHDEENIIQASFNSTGVPTVQRQEEPGLFEQVVGFATESSLSVINYLAPGLISFLREGIGPRLMELLCTGINSFVSAAVGKLEGLDFVTELENKFQTAIEKVHGFVEGIRGGISDELGGPLVEAIEKDGLPFVRRIQTIIDKINQTFASIWSTLGQPVADFLGEIGGTVWQSLTRLAGWLWDLTRPVREVAGAAWE